MLVRKHTGSEYVTENKQYPLDTLSEAASWYFKKLRRK